MDTSLNQIDMMYLCRANDLGKLYGKQETNNTDKNKYEKRILDITSEMMRGRQINPVINDAFEQYIEICIRHFKFMDKAATIQTDYLNMKVVNKKKVPECSLEEANKIILKKKTTTIKDFLEIKKTAPPPFYPKIRKL